MSDINWKDKCFVATIYLVDSNLKKVLLTWNKNIQTWIPVGGHIEPGETPEDAIIREVNEETGLDFEFFSPSGKDKDGDVAIVRNYRVQVESVPHHNKHINFVFMGKCKANDKIETDENEKLRWFSSEEIEKTKMIDSVKNLSLESLKLF